MKTTIKTILIAGCFQLGFTSLQAATVNLDDFWNGDSSTLKSAMNNAVNAAGNFGTVRLSGRTYQTDRQIQISRPVRIVGKNRLETVIKRTDSSISRAVCGIAADNVEFNALAIDANIINPVFGEGFRSGIQNTGRDNFKFINGAILNAHFGYNSGAGNTNKGLLLRNIVFVNNHSFGVWIYSNDRRKQPINSGRFEIRNCVFKRDCSMGINIDYGLEREDKDSRSIDLRTNGRHTFILECYVEKMRQFGIAISRSLGVDVIRCTAEGGGGRFRPDYLSGIDGRYSQALHVEDRCRSVRSIDSVWIQNQSPATGNNFNSAVLFGAGLPTDGFNRDLHNCIIRGGSIKGSTRWGLFLENIHNLTVENVSFEIQTISPRVNAIHRATNLKFKNNPGLQRSEINLRDRSFINESASNFL